MGITMRPERAQDAAKLTSEVSLNIDDNALIDKRQLAYLRRGLAQPGGKLPLFDLDGQSFEPQVVRSCLAAGWAEPWFANPLKPDWLVCKLTDRGRDAVQRALH